MFLWFESLQLTFLHMNSCLKMTVQLQKFETTVAFLGLVVQRRVLLPSVVVPSLCTFL